MADTDLNSYFDSKSIIRNTWNIYQLLFNANEGPRFSYTVHLEVFYIEDFCQVLPSFVVAYTPLHVK